MLLELFGPQEDEDFAKASEFVMTSTPSHLARQLIDIMCPKHPSLHCFTLVLSGSLRMAYLLAVLRRHKEQTSAGLGHSSVEYTPL